MLTGILRGLVGAKHQTEPFFYIVKPHLIRVFGQQIVFLYSFQCHFLSLCQAIYVPALSSSLRHFLPI